MNHFELYEIEPCLIVDISTIKKKYYSLARTWHPDKFVTATSQEQQLALINTAQINKAFTLFNSPFHTIEYVLSLYQIIIEDEKFQLPPNFLMEMMEVNEAIQEMTPNNPESTHIQNQITFIEDNLSNSIAPVLKKKLIQELTDTDWQALKNYYYKTKYLLRIKENLSKFATP